MNTKRIHEIYMKYAKNIHTYLDMYVIRSWNTFFACELSVACRSSIMSRKCFIDAVGSFCRKNARFLVLRRIKYKSLIIFDLCD